MSLAEVYVMKKIHKEKMESATEKGNQKADSTDYTKTLLKKKKISNGGCFPMVFKKIHPNGIAS
ncbi:hypothetical protein DCAR_0521298 [Daucus carota subsp. sativus]|uniref:Uncharacterized protein n=1 Tax=Daucus carota subsp. sativus TaxID=79200 RepID=A0AAF1B2U6_DAUCS|nr:hypothetical protein DCAR_0521298 [Daucus carota subsp. sativus]